MTSSEFGVTFKTQSARTVSHHLPPALYFLRCSEYRGLATSYCEPFVEVMPITVLRHRGRPRGEAPEAFDLRRNGWKPDLPARRQHSNRTALPTTNYPTTPTRNRNVPKYPLRGKPQIRKTSGPYSSTEKTSVWLTRSSSSCSAAISSATAR